MTAIAKDIILDFLDYYDYEIRLIVPFYSGAFVQKNELDTLYEHMFKRYVPPAEQSGAFSAALDKQQKMVRGILKSKDISLSAELVQFNSLQELMCRMEAPFVTRLFRYIDARGMSDVDVYKGALIDRKLFSKIRKGNYTPRKNTILALAVSLKLNLDETQDLLKSAGYILTNSSKLDLIVGFYIEQEEYDLFKINEALYKFGLTGLGSIVE